MGPEACDNSLMHFFYKSRLFYTKGISNVCKNERKLTTEIVKAYKIGEMGRNIIFPYWRDDEC